MIKWYHIFLVDREKGNEKDGKLRLRIRWGDNIVAFNLGFRVEFAKWSKETQRCKNGTSHGKDKISASVINREINRYEEAAEETFNSFSLQGISPSKDEFRAKFLNIARGIELQTDKDKKLLELIDDFMHEMGMRNGWSMGTYANIRTLKKHMEEFNPNITFSDLDEKGLLEYTLFLQNEYGQRNNTTLKQIKIIKWFLLWATKKGYNKTNDFLAFTPKFKVTDRKIIFLDWDELMKVFYFTFPARKQYLERVRDVFCFCCFTGLRYSDVANLKKSDINNNVINITTIKTHDMITIELNDYSKAILSKYVDAEFENESALPIISNQRMNDYLKEMGETCGINATVTMTYYKGGKRYDETCPKFKLLTTHCGRRTFICNALMLGIQPEIIMKWGQ